MKVIIDPGHGDGDIGSAFRQIKENDLNLKIAYIIRQHLIEKSSLEVELTREIDEEMSLRRRCKLANRKNADLFYSIHVNASGDPAGSPRGYEDYVWRGLSEDSDTVRIRQTIHEHLVRTVLKDYGIPDRGMKQADFLVLRETRMPAILTENLFVDNEKDRSLLKNPSFIKRLGIAHAEGIAEGINTARSRLL